MLECECRLQYVFRTARSLSVHIGEHMNNIKKGLRSHSVSTHFRNLHNRDLKGFRFWGIEIQIQLQVLI